ncbi:MAG: response regulator, partial [Anaerolineae bacterium]|nr:response regulator [Anaerolineae bacterium]
MQRLLRAIFDLTPYDTPIERSRARVVYLITAVLMVGYTFYALIAVPPDNISLLQKTLDNPAYLLLMGVFYGMAFASIIFTQRGKVFEGGLALVVMWYVGTMLASAVAQGVRSPVDGFVFIAFVLLAGLLLSERSLFLVIPLAIFTLAAGIISRESGSAAVDRYDFIVMSLQIVVAGAVTYRFLHYARQHRDEGSSEAMKSRFKLAQLTTQVSQQISRRMSLSEVLTEAVEQIRQQYPSVYHVQIFLTHNGDAELVASTGEVGRQLVQQQHTLKIGERSVVGQAAAQGKPIFAWANAPDTVHRPNELLPDTQSEAAFPLHIGNTVTGVLDLQSKKQDAFQPIYTPIFQSLADSLAIAIENARFYEHEQTRRKIAAALVEIAQSINSSLEVEDILKIALKRAGEVIVYDTASIWLREGQILTLVASSGFTHDEKLKGMTVSGENPNLGFLVLQSQKTRVVTDVQQLPEWKIGLADFEGGDLTRSWMGAPLIVRGKSLGLLTFDKRDKVNFYSEEDGTNAQLFAEQIATAVYNAQLYQQTLAYAQKMEQARHAAESASRAKSTFLANMNHELRTPLNAIIGYSSLVLGGTYGPVTDLQSDRIRRVADNGNHLLNLINDVLDLSKIEAGKMELFLETFEIKGLLESAVESARPLALKNSNRIETTIPDSIGKMNADLTKVRQILFNLLSNAAKFTENGTIALTVTEENLHEEKWFTFEVRDTGIGMSRETQERIFTEFIQADASTTRKYGGTGLGLAISRRFCEMMGGSIQVASEAGIGSVFTVRLPANVMLPKERTPESDPLPMPTRSHLPHTGETVLIIDDDATVRDLMTQYLMEEGYRVVTTSRGEEGLKLAKELKPNIITLDVMMPEMDGWGVLALLKADPELADIPVIMLTIIDNKRMGYALGASEYLTKPINPVRLREILRKYLKPPCPILVVEDEESIRLMMVDTLKAEGWEVYEAENGRVALEKMEKHQPELVILDLMMPEMD